MKTRAMQVLVALCFSGLMLSVPLGVVYAQDDGAGLLGAGCFGIMLCLSMLILIGVPIVMVIVFFRVRQQVQEKEAVAKGELQQLVRSLPQESQAAFMVQYNARQKKPSTAVLLAVFLGWLGLHKFYLDDNTMGIVYIVLAFVSGGIIPLILSLMESFTIAQKVIDMNRQLALETAALLGADIDASALLGLGS